MLALYHYILRFFLFFVKPTVTSGAKVEDSTGGRIGFSVIYSVVLARNTAFCYNESEVMTMFELTNHQRRCLGLQEIPGHWFRKNLKPRPGDDYETWVYIDGTTLRKCISSGEKTYTEYDYSEPLSGDLEFLLPKTSRGKPIPLCAVNLWKRPAFMCLCYARGYVSLYHNGNQRNYYNSLMENCSMPNHASFIRWVESWCMDTSDADITDVNRFAAEPRKHIKFREGDVFRYRITRRLWGYGRVLLDYSRMRKKKEPFWDILMMKPVVCSAYHIATEDPNVPFSTLERLPSLPSCIMADNHIFYGEYEIIGNIPVSDHEDYPILYGESIRCGENAVMLQQGKIHRVLPGETAAVSNDFRNNSVGFSLNVRLPVLLECIRQGSNAPYWAQNNWYTRRDLRNPEFSAEREAICRQFGIDSLI